MLKYVVLLVCLAFMQLSVSAQWNYLVLPNDSTTLAVGEIINDSTFYLAGRLNNQECILKTYDSGVTFDTVLLNMNGIVDIEFPSDSIGYALSGQYQTLYKTTDAGISWILTVSGMPNAQFWDIHFLNDTIGYLVNDSRIYKTLDGANSWNLLQNEAGGRTIQFLTDSQAYSCSSGVLCRSNDGFDTFDTIVQLFHNTFYLTVSFTNENQGFMGGIAANGSPYFNFGMISRTQNGGEDWDYQGFQSMYSINSIVMLSDSTGYAIGTSYPVVGSSFILKTIDGGEHWYKQEADPTPYISQTGWNVYCWNEDRCIATAYFGAVYYTTNGGGPLLDVAINEPTTLKNQIKLYPNPTSTSFTIALQQNNPSPQKVEVYDLQGRLVLQQNWQDPQSATQEVSVVD